MVGTMVDVSRRRQIEEKLRTTAESLSIAQAAGRIATYHVNHETGQSVISSNFSEITGLSQTQGALRGTEWLNFVHPEDRLKVLTPRVERIAGGFAVSREYRIILPDGTLRWVDERTKQTLGASGEVVRRTGVMIDITTRKQAEFARAGRSGQPAPDPRQPDRQRHQVHGGGRGVCAARRNAARGDDARDPLSAHTSRVRR